jgi:predicted acylesterase/phospholipase RssA
LNSEQEKKPEEMEIALALSGGGFRAAFFHVGVLRRLFQLGLFRNLKTISSVSGGSFVNGLIGLHFDAIKGPGKIAALIYAKESLTT